MLILKIVLVSFPQQRIAIHAHTQQSINILLLLSIYYNYIQLASPVAPNVKIATNEMP